MKRILQEISNLNIKKLKNIRNKIEDKILKTPCIYSESLSNIWNKDIYLKLENLQKTGAFKIRGNSYKILSLDKEEIKKGVVTASSGNHGLGLSLAGSLAGSKVQIYVPEKTPQNKIEKIKSYGAEVSIKGKTYDDAVEFAKEKAENSAMTYIPSFDDFEIILGNSTLGLEIFEEVGNPEMVICPIGGGGGASGISITRDIMSPETEIIGVEAAGAASLKESLQKGKRTKLSEVTTLADGIKVAQPGKLTFQVLKERISGIKTVTEKQMKEACHLLLTEAKITAELAGAASVAALNEIDLTKINGPIICIITGGNIDQELIEEILAARR